MLGMSGMIASQHRPACWQGKVVTVGTSEATPSHATTTSRVATQGPRGWWPETLGEDTFFRLGAKPVNVGSNEADVGKWCPTAYTRGHPTGTELTYERRYGPKP